MWVEAVRRGPGSVIERPTSFTVTPPEPIAGLEARADELKIDDQEPQGTRKAYVFDPIHERYERVGDMELARWYPSLVGLADGKVLALSGLDEFGHIVPGNNEVYDPASGSWTSAPELERPFPTYPAVFLVGANRLFYSGSNAGYGPPTSGTRRGSGTSTTTRFDAVDGLRDPDQTRDQRRRLAAAGAAAAVHGGRRRRRRRVEEVHGARGHRRPQRARAALQGGPRPPGQGAVTRTWSSRPTTRS